jgi:hypothetical protein
MSPEDSALRMTALARASGNFNVRPILIRTITPSVQVKKEILVVSLKGLGAKTN